MKKKFVFFKHQGRVARVDRLVLKTMAIAEGARLCFPWRGTQQKIAGITAFPTR
jgi:uncharacterized pyridoxamine 5'-phosphate oxidase family protein